jgi:hypothetical protein
MDNKQNPVMVEVNGVWVEAVPAAYPYTWNEKLMRVLRTVWSRLNS